MQTNAHRSKIEGRRSNEVAGALCLVPGARRSGFTLIELLTVIVIIGLLLTILVPSIQAIVKQSYAAKTQSRIDQISGATNTYYIDQNRMYYPGQQFLFNGGTFCQGAIVFGTGNRATECLALALFNVKNGAGTTRDSFKPKAAVNTNGYLPYSEDFFTDPNGTGVIIADCFPDAMPILYMPSHTIVNQALDNTTGQFLWADNGDPANVNSINSCSYDPSVYWNNSALNSARNNGTFLLMTAGVDRTNGTQDDLRNW